MTDGFKKPAADEKGCREYSEEILGRGSILLEARQTILFSCGCAQLSNLLETTFGTEFY